MRWNFDSQNNAIPQLAHDSLDLSFQLVNEFWFAPNANFIVGFLTRPWAR